MSARASRRSKRSRASARASGRVGVDRRRRLDRDRDRVDRPSPSRRHHSSISIDDRGDDRSRLDRRRVRRSPAAASASETAFAAATSTRVVVRATPPVDRADRSIDHVLARVRPDRSLVVALPHLSRRLRPATPTDGARDRPSLRVPRSRPRTPRAHHRDSDDDQRHRIHVPSSASISICHPRPPARRRRRRPPKRIARARRRSPHRPSLESPPPRRLPS